MKRKLAQLIVLSFFLPLLFQGCGTTEVAKGQQTVHASAISLDSFVTFERNNRATLWKINPGVKHTADKLRHKECETCEPNGVKYLESAWNLVEVYRTNRTPDNKANMDTALAVVQDLIDEITNYFGDPQISALDPSTAATYSKHVKVVP